VGLVRAAGPAPELIADGTNESCLAMQDVEGKEFSLD